LIADNKSLLKIFCSGDAATVAGDEATAAADEMQPTQQTGLGGIFVYIPPKKHSHSNKRNGVLGTVFPIGWQMMHSDVHMCFTGNCLKASITPQTMSTLSCDICNIFCIPTRWIFVSSCRYQ